SQIEKLNTCLPRQPSRISKSGSTGGSTLYYTRPVYQYPFLKGIGACLYRRAIISSYVRASRLIVQWQVHEAFLFLLVHSLYNRGGSAVLPFTWPGYTGILPTAVSLDIKIQSSVRHTSHRRRSCRTGCAPFCIYRRTIGLERHRQPSGLHDTLLYSPRQIVKHIGIYPMEYLFGRRDFANECKVFRRSIGNLGTLLRNTTRKQ